MTPLFHCRLSAVKRDGYVLLLSVLIIGAVSAVVLPSLLFLGINAGQVSVTIEQSAQALAAAQGCAEYGLLRLRENMTYQGDETKALDDAECTLLPIDGIGNEDRHLCSEGRSEDTVRRLEIIVRQVSPQMTVDSWQEVASFTLCQ